MLVLFSSDLPAVAEIFEIKDRRYQPMHLSFRSLPNDIFGECHSQRVRCEFLNGDIVKRKASDAVTIIDESLFISLHELCVYIRVTVVALYDWCVVQGFQMRIIRDDSLTPTAHQKNDGRRGGFEGDCLCIVRVDLCCLWG